MVTKKELLIKSAVYRVFVIAYEALLGVLIAWMGMNILQFVVINNAVKFVGYFFTELIWFQIVHTRWRIIEKWVLSRFRSEEDLKHHDQQE